MLLCLKLSDFSSAEVDFLGDTLEFEILNVLEFTSDRKRMSVVVRDHSTGRLHLLTKGADETVFRIIRAGMQILILSCQLWSFVGTAQRPLLSWTSICTGFLLQHLICGIITSTYSTGEPVQQVADAVDQYSQLGLRTLCFAWRDLDEQEYASWAVAFNEASASLTEREVRQPLLLISEGGS
jgi:phospholipid-translocating ATPase